MNEKSLEMPWEIRELPYMQTARKYTFWPDGVSHPSTPDELRVWDYVQALTAEIAQLKEQAEASKAKKK